MTTVHAGELILLWSNRATKQCYLHISRVGMLKLHEITLHEVREVRIRAILAEVPAQLRTVTRKVSNFTLGEFKLCDSKLPKLQPFQCFWCRCANLRIQGSSGFSAQKSHRRQNAAPVPTNTRRRSNSPPCQKKSPNSNLIQFDLCFNCHRPFHTPIAPYTNGTAPTSCNPIAWPIHTYKSRWNLALWILQRLVAIIYYPFCYFTFSCSTDSCSKTWWKLMHLYMLPLAKLVLSRPTHTSSDHLQGITTKANISSSVVLFTAQAAKTKLNTTTFTGRPSPFGLCKWITMEHWWPFVCTLDHSWELAFFYQLRCLFFVGIQHMNKPGLFLTWRSHKRMILRRKNNLKSKSMSCDKWQ